MGDLSALMFTPSSGCTSTVCRLPLYMVGSPGQGFHGAKVLSYPASEINGFPDVVNLTGPTVYEPI